jgi:hypothetical protein
MLLIVGEFRENLRKEGRKKFAFIFACTLKPKDILRVQKALLKPVYCVKDHSS